MGKTARKYLNELKMVFNTQKKTGQGMAFVKEVTTEEWKTKKKIKILKPDKN